MSVAQRPETLPLPISLETQLYGFRRRVWTIKMAEALAAAACSVLVAFLCLFALDRLWDTPRWLRMFLWIAGFGGCAVVPFYLHHWVWRRRHLEQLARLLSRKLPRLGDQLLGIIELTHSAGEQKRSRALCEAAIQHVAKDAEKRDLSHATPASRHRLWAWFAAAALSVSLVLGTCYPAAASNAWARFLTPWSDTPRYTFAALEPLPDEIVVPHGEPFLVTVRLASHSRWRPESGQARLGDQPAVHASLAEGAYCFELPAQISDAILLVSIGDSKQVTRITPVLRPELTAISADVTLPKYLGRPKPLSRDVRGGSVSLVKGCQASFVATASRALVAAKVDGRPQTPDQAAIRSPVFEIETSRNVEFRWLDEFGLEGKEPFTLSVTARNDEAPTLACEDMPRSKVVLDSEQINFRVKGQDDFGIKQIGLEWRPLEGAVVDEPAQGEQILAAGGVEQDLLDVTGAFSARSAGISPQPIELRVFAEDYYPGRERVYSPTYVLYVLSPEQHAIWMTEQLNKWHRLSLEVRDREMQLHETNKQLRDLAPEELDQPETRRRIESQASAERANSRRLTNLTQAGEELIRQAMRNPEFDVGHLERWAEMLQILKDISANRMPSVADLLKEASQARAASGQKPAAAGPKAGKDRAAAAGNPSQNAEENKTPPPPTPKISDMESSLQPPDNKPKEPAPPKPPSSSGLRLPTTTLIGGGPKASPPPSPAGEKMEQAVAEQQELLAEFEKILNELNNILANLEGSTLVKRLKAASREQSRVAGCISDQLEGSFGRRPSDIDAKQREVFAGLSEVETKSSQTVSYIMDDMQAYFERRRFLKFQTVLEEMKSEEVVASLRDLADDMSSEPGLSIAQCEYWWDTMDRWAEDLVDPACSGTCRCSGSGASLPPSIVREVLQILEGEMNLREETRVAEQAKPALANEEYEKRAKKLADTQSELQQRTVAVCQDIRNLPDGDQVFAKEIRLLDTVATVMDEATEILASPETGRPAIGVETEIIELLLQSRRINPKGGGGGGSSPGGGGTGDTMDSALALLGVGANDKEVREARNVGQATGESGRTLPEEFRAGLDEYFNRFEQQQPAGGE